MIILSIFYKICTFAEMNVSSSLWAKLFVNMPSEVGIKEDGFEPVQVGANQIQHRSKVGVELPRAEPIENLSAELPWREHAQVLCHPFWRRPRACLQLVSPRGQMWHLFWQMAKFLKTITRIYSYFTMKFISKYVLEKSNKGCMS